MEESSKEKCRQSTDSWRPSCFAAEWDEISIHSQRGCHLDAVLVLSTDLLHRATESFDKKHEEA